jgi:hypothetical protein
MVTIHDTIITPTNKIDTFFSNTIDTFYFEKDNFKNGKKVGKLKLSYSNNKGKINLKADSKWFGEVYSVYDNTGKSVLKGNTIKELGIRQLTAVH